MTEEDLPLAKLIKDKSEMKTIILPVIYSYRDKRDLVLQGINEEELKKNLRTVKERSLDDIENLLAKTIKNLTKNGIIVHEAKLPTDVKRIMHEIIGDEKNIVKSKSNLANEIGLRDMLSGKELIETDVGDYLVELSHGAEAHPVLPALLLTPQKIADSIKKQLGADVDANPESIVSFLRGHIRKKILDAKIGITGANAMTADGSIVILENEGNISLVSRMPEKHIILASFDKIVPTREDAMLVVKCAAIYGTGQDYPSYVSIISGPSKTADIQNQMVTGAQGAKEVHLILVDNHRSEILKSDFKELLYCINCGACVNFCPIYHQITTDYGSTFPGLKGVLLSAFNESLKRSFEHGAFYCTGCQNCKQNCPAKIDLPALNKKLRQQLVKAGIEPNHAEEMIKNVGEFGNPFGKVEKGKIPKSLYCC